MKISASSLKLFRNCPRRFYYDKVLRLGKFSETPATTLGKKVHGELEDWTRLGKVPEHPLAQKMLAAFAKLPHWPDPRAAIAEEGFTFSLDGLEWHGFVDVRREGRHAKHRIVLDYKTTADLQYALKAGDGMLVDSDGLADIQSVIYSAREYIEGADEVTCIWLYGASKAPHATRLVSVDMDFGKVETEMKKACVDGHRMVRLDLVKPEPAAVPFNSGFCHSYHRQCEHWDRCPKSQRGLFSAPEPLDLKQGDHVMNFLDAIKNSHPATAKTAAPPPPPPEDDEAPPPPPEDEDDVPPPPPEEEPHPAEIVAEAAICNPATRDLSTAVESGFVNPVEAAGKAPYTNPAEAAVGEGVAPVVEKPKAKGRKKAKVDLDEKVTADGTTLGEAIKEMRGTVVVPEEDKARLRAQFAKAVVDSNGFSLTEGQRFDTKTGEDLRAKYAELETSVARAQDAPAPSYVETHDGEYRDSSEEEIADEEYGLTDQEALAVKQGRVLRGIYDVLRAHFEG